MSINFCSNNSEFHKFLPKHKKIDKHKGEKNVFYVKPLLISKLNQKQHAVIGTESIWLLSSAKFH
jgi:hypothetical protein